MRIERPVWTGLKEPGTNSTVGSGLGYLSIMGRA